MFPSGKACKKYLEFPANQKFARIILLRLNFIGRSRLGTRLVVVFYDVHASPCVQRLGVNTPCHADAWPGFGYIMPYYAFLCGVEHSLLLGWSVSVTGWAVRSHAVFMWSFLQDRDREGYIAIGSVNRSVPWLAPKNYRAAILSSLEVNFAHSNLEA